jgi:hypothetical protein
MTRQKCLATTAKGQPCRAWAVHDSNPPRCAAHGGSKTPIGAPLGNSNAQTHGAYAESGGDPVDLSARIRDLDRRITGLSQYIDDNMHELDPRDYAALLALHGQLSSRLGRLMRDRASLGGDHDDELHQAMNEALDLVAQDLGIEL